MEISGAGRWKYFWLDLQRLDDVALGTPFASVTANKIRRKDSHMKKAFGAVSLILALTSGSSMAESPPAGAERFTRYFNYGGNYVVPDGRTLVVTDIVRESSGDLCRIQDGAVTKIGLPAGSSINGTVNFQTGIEFTSNLFANSNCGNLTITGYLL